MNPDSSSTTRYFASYCLPIAVVCVVTFFTGASADVLAEQPSSAKLANTDLLTMQGDIASQLVDAADQFLDQQLIDSHTSRERHWQRELSSQRAYAVSIASNRSRLRRILGIANESIACRELSLLATTEHSALVGTGDGYEVLEVQWSAFGDVTGFGLMLEPKDRAAVVNVVAIPHCDITPEQLCGLVPGLPAQSQFARRLAESGCRVVIPLLINRTPKMRGISHREWLHRAAYEMGRTLTGYELEKVLALVSYFDQQDLPVGVFGWGDGGRLATYAAALDDRIDVVVTSGDFGSLATLWRQPLDRMVFSLLDEFDDARLAAMIAPRRMIVEYGTAPTANVAMGAGNGGAPYTIEDARADVVETEVQAARRLASGLTEEDWLTATKANHPGHESTLAEWLNTSNQQVSVVVDGVAPQAARALTDPQQRHAQQFAELDRHTQSLLRDSQWARQERFWKQLDTSSLQAYESSLAPLRKSFYDDVIGRFDLPLADPHPRSRTIEETDQWIRYEVVLDVFDGLFAYGLLTVPKGIGDGERRPVVVCQHGLEGRPQSVIGEKDFHYYKAFATALAERGYVTFAPQNPYIFEDRFRTLQRKANTIGKTLFSLIVPQHQQIVNWLQTLPCVDGDRIAFYGLSYGGKTAMRVPPLVREYCLSICSADFNEWVDKNASTHNPRSYVNTGEYEIFEWNLGHTFNYAEMAALIAPRPFMVERGHSDGVADDWTVAWEYAKVRRLYAAELKIGERTEIEWFDGPHSINGVGTYQFLDRHFR
ncbi:MAG: hypothetical protein R3E01_31665 [Pirellulaceae bacterium]|nr:hypothetical protein [Planctomycetales bacterium]